MLPPAFQTQWVVHTALSARVPSGHCPHLSHPDEVAGVLAAAVARGVAVA